MTGSEAVIAAAPGPGRPPEPEPLTVLVTIVIPAFNEVEGVGLTIDRVRRTLAKTPHSFDIVVVDDGSTDGTGDAAKYHGARVTRLRRNRGYGAALKAGILSCQSEYVAITDADGTYPAEAIPVLLAGMEHADMVVGARSARDPSIPRVRRPAKLFLAILSSYLAGQWIPDLNSGLRITRRSLLLEFLHLLPSGFSFTTTITLALMCTGHSVSYEPIVCGQRVGSSKLRAKDFTAFVMLVLRTVVLFNPLKVFLPLGGLLVVIGSVKLIYDILLWNLSETAVMAFLSAIIVWSVGLLADMISRLQLHRHGPR
jgi:glycosyltransferase involved in cell wall biosynthesis